LRRDVIVVGATIGSTRDVGNLLRDLPGDLPAAVLVVVHIPRDHPSILPEMSEASAELEVFCPKDNVKLGPGRVYLVSPNHHLLVEKGKVRVYRSPEENLHRPAVDPLFRSAAHYYGPRVAGVLLSKSDSDGTSGLYSIKLKKGVTVLRDPSEAHLPVMPWSADRHVRIDYQLPLAGISTLLAALAEGKRVRNGLGGKSAHAV
jgi:two-component system, chemotaxis family, protein-glutamate methylesterase/glutaminase